MIKIKKIKKVEEETFYHGSNKPIDTFVDDFVGNGNDVYGPGIYFSNNPNDSYGYISNDGKFYVCDLDIKKELTKKTRFNKNIVLKFMKESPDEYAWTDWDENKNVAYQKALKALMETEYADNLLDALTQVWYDWYRDFGTQYVRNLVKLGYDASIHTLPSGTKFAVVYNPKIIKVKQVLDKEEALEYIQNNKLSESLKEIHLTNNFKKY